MCSEGIFTPIFSVKNPNYRINRITSRTFYEEPFDVDPFSDLEKDEVPEFFAWNGIFNHPESKREEYIYRISSNTSLEWLPGGDWVDIKTKDNEYNNNNNE